MTELPSASVLSSSLETPVISVKCLPNTGVKTAVCNPREGGNEVKL